VASVSITPTKRLGNKAHPREGAQISKKGAGPEQGGKHRKVTNLMSRQRGFRGGSNLS